MRARAAMPEQLPPRKRAAFEQAFQEHAPLRQLETASEEFDHATLSHDFYRAAADQAGQERERAKKEIEQALLAASPQPGAGPSGVQMG